jgi:hypothetical protein
MAGAVLAVIGFWSAPAAAQEVSLGYQFQRFSGEGESLSAPLGFNLDVAGPLSGDLDLVGQLDWSRRSESEVIFGTSVEASFNFTTFGGGVRWSSRANPDMTPFVHALFGATRSSFSCEVAGADCDDFFDEDTSSTDPMFQLGGGVAIPMGAWSALGQIDYRRIFGGDGLNALRFVLGVRLGMR